MKKLIFAGLILALLVLAVPAVAHTESDPFVTDLLAGQTMKVGEVQVWNDAGTLYVKYVIDDPDWCITETHLQVATSWEDIPQMNGNPIPGKFEENDEHDCVREVEYAFDLSDKGLDCGCTTYIAAHAVVWDKTSETSMVIVSDTETNVVEVNGVLVTQYAVLANEPLNYPTCNDYEPDATGSAWDLSGGSQRIPDAHWIWNTLDPEHPKEGDVVTFQKTFSLDGWPTGGTLDITADNGYNVMLNDELLGSAQLGPGFPGTLKETVDSTPQDSDWGVASQGWQSVEPYSLDNLVSGPNTLTITASNEYMWSDDKYYANYAPPSEPIQTDPEPGDGPGVYPCYNPAGLIFKVTADYYSESETAWGDGEDFPGKNWATYFTYDVQCEQTCEWPEGGVVSIAYEDLPIKTNIPTACGSGLDWDYNDWVADISTEFTYWTSDTECPESPGEVSLTKVNFTIEPETRFAGYSHTFGLKIDADTFECSGSYDLTKSDGTYQTGSFSQAVDLDLEIVPDTVVCINECDIPTEINIATLNITFDEPCLFDFSGYDPFSTYHGEDLFFTPYIYVKNTGETIPKSDYVSTNGYDPRMLVVPVDWQWPTEAQSIWNAYTKVSILTSCFEGPVFVEEWWV